ncbi:MAG: carbohydrate porin [Mariprofundaceae bacterium]|nr:carbohydrate porin [Mariprofundaceae bacterium]
MLKKMLWVASLLWVPTLGMASDFEYELGTTIIAQSPNKAKALMDKSATASVDVLVDWSFGTAGTLHAYVEASTQADITANTLVAGSNMDAGTALNKKGKGRVQISELFYSYNFADDDAGPTLSAGVILLQGFADETEISNAEQTHFIAAPLVNNSSIPFPDYTPAIVLSSDDKDVAWRVMVANAYGLADNANMDYADLFKFSNGAGTPSKGLFSLAQMRLSLDDDTSIAIGAWVSTKELARHTGAGTKQGAVGSYINVDSVITESILWSGRLGYTSSKETMEVVSFASVAFNYQYNDEFTVGLGTAYHGLSNEFRNTFVAPNVGANPIVLELYASWQITDWVSVMPDIQYWRNPNNLSASAVGTVSKSAVVYGLRLQFGYIPKTHVIDES